ncbi:MAG TPA: hypothetical protein VKZ53_03675 [Candidatus Angelobacter sp.]|nr:hypothetical protein [Candidatus Angelobacter sp.]
MEMRCQASRINEYDPTGESALECNAPAEYCPVCEMNICQECHSPFIGACIPHEKKRPASASTQATGQTRKIPG